MTGQAPLSYSAALSGKQTTQSTPQTQSSQPPKPNEPPKHHAPHNRNVQPPPPQTQQQRHSPTGAYTASTYTRNPDHKAHTTSPHETSYILSLLTSTAHHTALTSLRKQYFPAHLNKLDAHVALFRALPGSELPRVESDVAALAARTAPFAIAASKEPFRLRQGVGINVGRGGRESRAVYEELRGGWKGFLSRQDDGGFRAHYTVMNKVEDEAVVEGAMREIRETWGGDEGVVEGLVLWRYDRGYWRKEKEFRFEGK